MLSAEITINAVSKASCAWSGSRTSRGRIDLGRRTARGALTGLVSSADEGPMEGVLVSAKKDGSTITITVVTDAEGRYSFPADRLAPGTLHDLDPRGRLQARWPEDRRSRRRRRRAPPTSSSARSRISSRSSPTASGSTACRARTSRRRS